MLGGKDNLQKLNRPILNITIENSNTEFSDNI